VTFIYTYKIKKKEENVRKPKNRNNSPVFRGGRITSTRTKKNATRKENIPIIIFYN